MATRKPRAREPRAPWTLRRRLVLAVVGLLALVSLAIGLASVAILRASLLDGLDGRLASAADRSSAVLGSDGDGDEDHPRPTPSAEVILNGPAQPPGTLALVFDGTTITAGYTNDESGEIESLTAEQMVALLTSRHEQTCAAGGRAAAPMPTAPGVVARASPKLATSIPSTVNLVDRSAPVKVLSSPSNWSTTTAAWS